MSYTTLPNGTMLVIPDQPPVDIGGLSLEQFLKHTHSGNPGDAQPINAASATKLETARTINGIPFDGTANIVINQVSAFAGVSGLVIKTISNTNTTIDIASISLLDASNNARIFQGVSLTNIISNVGANGRQGGSVQPNQLYSLWIISKEDNTLASLLTLNTNTSIVTPPVLPTDYVYKRRIGFVWIDASGFLIRSTQRNDLFRYNTLLPLASGANGTPNPASYVVFSLNAFCPVMSAITALFVLSVNNGSVMIAPNNSYGSSVSLTNAPPFVVTSDVTTTETCELILEDGTLYYASTSATSIRFQGYRDNIL